MGSMLPTVVYLDKLYVRYRQQFYRATSNKADMTDNSHPGLRKLLKRTEGVLQDYLSAVLSLIRSLDHSIGVQQKERELHRHLFHFYSSEIVL